MRFGCLQFAPERGAAADNMILADTILSRASSIDPAQAKIDVLVLPEMVSTGSGIASRQTRSAPHDRASNDKAKPWVLKKSREQKCPVVVCHGEEVDILSAKPINTECSSSCIIAEDKALNLTNNTGRNQVEDDKSFLACEIPSLGKVSIGQFTDFGDEEFRNSVETQAFARHILAMDSDVGIVCTAWEMEEALTGSAKKRNEPDMAALSCWTARLEPLIRAERDKEVFIVLCNRVGTDGISTYAGTSVVLGIKDGRVLVYGLMGRLREGLLVVDTSQEPIAALRACKQEVVACDGERYTASPTASQMEPLTPDTLDNGPILSKESSPKPALEETYSPSVRTADAIAIAHLPNAAPEQTEAATKRPTVKIPKLTCLPPQEMHAYEYRYRPAAAPLPRATVRGTIRSPEASTPYPHSGYGRLQGRHMDTRINPATHTMTFMPLTPFTPLTPTTPFWDLATPISPTSAWSIYSDDPAASHVPDMHSKGPENSVASFSEPVYHRGSSPARPRTPGPSRWCSPDPRGRQRSTAAGPKLSGSRSHSTKSRESIPRPISPKSRNLEISVSFELPSKETGCGTIPILASPSIMTTDSRTECGSVDSKHRSQRQRRGSKEDSRSSSRGSTRHGLRHSTKSCTECGSPQSRGRSRKQRFRPEKNTRSSSTDSTTNGLLHRRVKSSDCDDGGVRKAGAWRSQSAGSLRPGNVFRSTSSPAIGDQKNRGPKASPDKVVHRGGAFPPWPASRGNGEQARAKIHEPLVGA